MFIVSQAGFEVLLEVTSVLSLVFGPKCPLPPHPFILLHTLITFRVEACSIVCVYTVKTLPPCAY